MNSNESLLNYAEGTRTSGEFIERFKTGTFKQVLDYVEGGGDMMVVPVYINYDKRIDSRFFGVARKYRAKRDVFLEKKQFWRARLCDWVYYGLDFSSFVVRIFSKDKGNAYLYFGEPFSIKQFLVNVEGRGKVALSRKARDEVVVLENLYKHRNA